MKILFIGARLFNEVAYFARLNGIETILTESNPDSPYLDLADEYHIVPRGMEKPMELAISRDVDAVVPLIGIDKPLMEVAAMKDKLEKEHGLPVVASGTRATEISTDKYQTKKFLEENKLKTPGYTGITRAQYSGGEVEIDYPVVLKQSEGQGGIGVKIALSPQDTADYLKQYPQAMMEEYVNGGEISVEVLRWDNKSVPLIGVYKGDTTLTGTHPIKKTRTAPVNIEGLDNEDLRRISQNIMDKIEGNGTAEVEFIFNRESGKINTLEINTRPSGTRFLTFCSSNINPMHQLVNMAMGEWNPQKVVREIKNYCALEMPLPPEKLHANPQLQEGGVKKQILTTEKPYIIHGPEKASRITIRSRNMDESQEIIKKLKIVEN